MATIISIIILISDWINGRYLTIPLERVCALSRDAI